MSSEFPSVFFPERMDSVEIIAPIQAAYDTVKVLAENGLIQLVDLNEGDKVSSKRYIDTLNRCEEANRSLDFIKTQLIFNDSLSETCPEKRGELLERIRDYQLQTVLNEIKVADTELREKLGIYDRFTSKLQSQMEQVNLLNFLVKTLSTSTERSHSANDENALLEGTKAGQPDRQIDQSPTCAGFVRVESQSRLRNTIYRATRRNALIYFGDPVNGSVPFVTVVSFESSLSKVEQICGAYSDRVYRFPSDINEIYRVQRELQDNIKQSEDVIKEAYENGISYLDSLKGKYWEWKAYITCEIEIWTAVDYGKFSTDHSAVSYRGWMPRRHVHQLGDLTKLATERSLSPVPVVHENTTAEDFLKSHEGSHGPGMVPPTYIETNEFTGLFQLLNDSYGVPDYDELNAGAFYCMYPFLFGVMFGDIGHSIFYILATIALFVVTSRAKKAGNNMSGLLGMIGLLNQAKWFLLFASLSALYCGLIYNECFGLPIFLFGESRFDCENLSSNGSCSFKSSSNVYPFGVDPNWLFSDNELLYLNSLKMKMSIVLGMCQMIFGLLLSGVNIYVSRHYAHFFTHFLPQLLYLVPFFGYLVVLIIIKWTKKYGKLHGGAESPSLISMMIDMILKFGSEPETTLYGGSTQKLVQTVITIIFFVSIPWLLLAQPLVDFIKGRKNSNFSILEAFVMNLIHVIEFCLSALSHTASYLRLWALSLAHSQLSNVLWEQLFMLGFSYDVEIASVITIVTTLAFNVMTVAILLGMESFSALLHAIRLMWVEFSSKFYHGQGIPFVPLSTGNALKNHGFYE